MSISCDSNAPYTTAFSGSHTGNAVYMTAEDALLGKMLAIIYRADPDSPKLSVVLIGNHGTSGYVNMTLDRTSRYYGACRSLARAHADSLVRRALAIAVLRTYATVDRTLAKYLAKQCGKPLADFDETSAGRVGSNFRLVNGKFPKEIGRRVLNAGLLQPKLVNTSVLDIVYEDSDSTIDQNNDLVYLLGDQLEQLFDPLSEYSPEPTELLYTPPTESLATLEDEPPLVQDICEELYLLQSNVRSDLIDFLQNFLIPLRVRVLSSDIPGMTIGKLNTLFPPTIDEMFRINNIFYEALQNALPYGAFEVLKACGTTIPYFYRACMRHEAATRNFGRSLASYDPELRHEIERYSMNRIETIIHCSLHLARTKLILERLVRSKQWSVEEKRSVDEYYQVANGTIDQFGKEKTAGSYNTRTFTPTGKLLVEIASNWPAELEYGWINRRVVTIFDAIDVLEVNSSRRQLHHIVIMFTDTVLILEPSEPIPMASLSGLHMPSIGDMLMHAMLNEVPLDVNLPPLKVVGWAPILDVTFSSFGPKSLMISSQPTPFSGDSLSGTGKPYTKIYQLVRPDHSADKFVELLAKAKVTTKTQPFHLFKIAEKETVTLYSTVHEIQGYVDEINRSQIAVFLNSHIDQMSLEDNGLSGAVVVAYNEAMDVINVRVVSNLGYHAEKNVTKDQFKSHVLAEVTYLATLSMSSQNAAALPAIAGTDEDISNKLLLWAQQPPSDYRAGHRRSLHPNVQSQAAHARAIMTNGSHAPPKISVSPQKTNRYTWAANDSPRLGDGHIPALPAVETSQPPATKSTASRPTTAPTKPMGKSASAAALTMPVPIDVPGSSSVRSADTFYATPSASPVRQAAHAGSVETLMPRTQLKEQPREQLDHPGDQSITPSLRKRDNFDMSANGVGRTSSARSLAQAPSIHDAAITTGRLQDDGSSRDLSLSTSAGSDLAISEVLASSSSAGAYGDSFEHQLSGSSRGSSGRSNAARRPDSFDFSNEIPQTDSDASYGYHFPARRGKKPSTDSSWTNASDNLSAAEEAEQRDVDAWYEGLNRRDVESLSSDISDVEHDDELDGDEELQDCDIESVHSPQRLPRSSSDSRSIQLGAFLDRSSSMLYNRFSGQAFPALSDISSQFSHSRDVSMATLESDAGSNIADSSAETETDDFAYLADLVEDGEVLSNSNSSNRLYAGLRESSLVRLGSYVVSSDRSQVSLTTPKLPTFDSQDKFVAPDFLGSNEPTPTLDNMTLGPDDEDESVADMLGPVSQWLARDEAAGQMTRSSTLRSLVNASNAANSAKADTTVTVDDVEGQASPPETPVLTMETQRRPRIPVSPSTGSLRRMIMSSSLNTLQLASFTVQIDQCIRRAEPAVQLELTRLRQNITELYNSTKSYASSYTSSKASGLGELVRREAEARRYVASMVWTLISLGYFSLVAGVLDIETIRRTGLYEALGSDTPLKLWQVPS